MQLIMGSRPEQPDSPPKHLYIGAINPFALVEALLGRKMDWNEAQTQHLLSSILQTDYEELFDMRFDSILYAGLRLNERGDAAELIPEKEMHTLTEKDLVTPDFSKVDKLGDLGRLGIKDLESVRVKHAFMSNGNLRLTLEPRAVGKKLRNAEMTTTLRELCTPFRVHEDRPWTPPNGNWVDVGAYCMHPQNPTVFSNPVQGATNNSWLVAALMSVAWSDPATIRHCSRGPDSHHPQDLGWLCDQPLPQHRRCSLSIKLYSKGGDKDAETATVKVNCELPTNNSSSLLMYCRPSAMNYLPRPGFFLGGAMGMGMGMGMHAGVGAGPHMGGGGGGGDQQSQLWSGELWPALYEKAFAKWISGDRSDREEEYGWMRDEGASVTDEEARAFERSEHPDITKTSHGDPVKAMAQLTDREPQYFFTSRRQPHDLLGLVRAHSFNLRTIYPTVAWTRPSDDKFRGCTLVGNMAYSVLGWAAPQERKQYIILRHPWGITEPEGMTSYPGVVAGVDAKFWAPIELIDRLGVFAIEAGAFKEYFAGLGVAK